MLAALIAIVGNVPLEGEIRFHGNTSILNGQKPEISCALRHASGAQFVPLLVGSATSGRGLVGSAARGRGLVGSATGSRGLIPRSDIVQCHIHSPFLSAFSAVILL